MRTKVRVGLFAAAVVAAALVLQAPGVGGGNGDKINKDTVIITVQWSPDSSHGGPPAVAISWLSHFDVEGSAVKRHPPAVIPVDNIRPGDTLYISSNAAKREGRNTGAVLECWVHKGGAQLAHGGPVVAPMGCNMQARIP